MIRVSRLLGLILTACTWCLLDTPLRSQNHDLVSPPDTVKLRRYPEFLNVRTSLAVGDDAMWLVTVHKRLYEWQDGRFVDISLEHERYHSIFAVSSSEVWLHLYDQTQYRFVFKKRRSDTWQVILDPDNEHLFSISASAPDDIWAAGVVGSLLHYDGRTWRRYPGLTNHHIRYFQPIDERRAAVVLEDIEGTLRLYRVDLGANRLTFLHLLTNRGFAGLPGGLWQVTNDSLRFLSFDGGIRKFDIGKPPSPIQAHPILPDATVTQSGKFWKVWRPEHPPFLLFRPTATSVMQLTNDGWLRRLPAAVSQPAVPAQFQASGVEVEGVYTTGCGFLDQDEHLDLYAVRPTAKNLLLLKRPVSGKGGSYQFRDFTVPFHAAETQFTRDGLVYYDHGILIADLNNDGDEDLFMTAHQGSNLYFENLNHRGFADHTAFANVFDEGHRWNMAAAGDVDRDGDLDLFVTREYTPNVLYLNDGYGRFEDATQRAGLSSERGGMACAFSDIDSDGDLDLFVANARTRNRLYRNLGVDEDTGVPIFLDITDSAGVGQDDVKRSTAAVFGDVDNDGDEDLYVVNRTTSGRLYLNDGFGRFEDVTSSAGLFQPQGFCEGAVWLDADHDGDLDLAVSCKPTNRFYRNLGGVRFREESPTVGFLKQGNTGTLISGDFDGDGDLDLFAPSQDKKTFIYVNQQDDRQWVKLRLRGVRSNSGAVGAKVYFYTAGHLGDPDSLLGLRTVQAGSGLASTNSKVVHFGTGQRDTVDCKIVFPSGLVVTRRSVAAGSSLTVEELQGLERFWIQLVGQLTRLPRQPESRTEIWFYLGFAFVMFLVLPHAIKRDWARWHPPYLLPVLVIVLLRILLREQGLPYRVGLPLAFGLLSFVLVAQVLYQRSRRAQEDELTDGLWNAVRQFQHGDWGRSNLNQLLFFAQNLNESNQHSTPLRQDLLHQITTYIQLTHPALRTISRIGQRSRAYRGAAETVGRAATGIYKCVETFKNKLQLSEPLRLNISQTLAAHIRTLKFSLDALTHQLDRNRMCGIRDHLRKVLQALGRREGMAVECVWESLPEVEVRIRPAELTAILHNLIDNARTATAGRPQPRLRIYAEQHANRVRLHFVDNGKGIPVEQQHEVFKGGFTTSGSKSKGMGLTFSRETLRKYDGDLYLAHSVPQGGSDFVLELVVIT